MFSGRAVLGASRDSKRSLFSPGAELGWVFLLIVRSAKVDVLVPYATADLCLPCICSKTLA